MCVIFPLVASIRIAPTNHILAWWHRPAVEATAQSEITLWDLAVNARASAIIDTLLSEATCVVGTEPARLYYATHALVDHARELREYLAAYIDSEHLEVILAPIADDMMRQFPPPDTAIGHDNRTHITRKVLEAIEERIIHVCVDIPSCDAERVHVHFRPISKALQEVIVLVGTHIRSRRARRLMYL